MNLGTRTFEDELVFHFARKKITFVDAQGLTIKPPKPNGMKLEMFVFGVFLFAKRFAVLEVVRDEELSPLQHRLRRPGDELSRPALAANAFPQARDCDRGGGC